MGFFSNIFGSYSEKEVKRVMPIVEKINGLEPGKTNRQRINCKNKLF